MEKNRINKKLILMIVLSVPSVIICINAFLMFCLQILFAERFPDEDMQKTLDFLQGEYVGMSLEECEDVFGQYDGALDDQVISYPAGHFKWGLSETYEVYIYFDDEGRVVEARLKEITER